MSPSVAFAPSTPSTPVRIHPKPPSSHQTRRGSPIRTPGIIMYNNAIHIVNHALNESSLANISVDNITHIFYSSASINADGRVTLSEIDTQVPVNGVQGCLRYCTKLREDRNAVLKIILSIGDGSLQATQAFREVARNDATRRACALSARHLVDSFGLHGIDINWDQIETTEDASNYILLLYEFRQLFPSSPTSDWYTLSSSVSFNKVIDYGAASHYLDLVNLKCFDFAGPLWSTTVSHTSQTYSPEGSELSNQGLSCYSAIGWLRRHRVPSSKIMLGIPTFGWGFEGASRVGEDYTDRRGEGRKWAYSELPQPGTHMEYDEVTRACYTRSPHHSGLISFDSPWSVQHKAELVKDNRLAGLVFWEATGDHTDSRRSIVAAGWQNLLPGGAEEG